MLKIKNNPWISNITVFLKPT